MPLKNKSWLKYLSLGTEFIVAIGIAVWIALWADARWHTSPLFIVILPLLGVIGVLYRVITTLSRDQKK